MTSPRNLIVLFLASLCYCTTSNGQQLMFDLYTRNNGLVSNEVYAMLQASNGFMYFGTPSGCSVYDGAVFYNYDRTKGFHTNLITELFERSPNEIDIFTGTASVYTAADRQLKVRASADSIAIKKIVQGKSGTQYAIAFSGVYQVQHNRLTNLPISNGVSYNKINDVVEWNDNLIVARSYESVDVYDRKTWKLVASSEEKLFVRDICVDNVGNVWLATVGQGVLLLKKNPAHGRIQFERLPSSFDSFSTKEFRAIVCDKTNTLWLGSISEGLIRYNDSTKVFQHITTDKGLISNTIFSLFNDREDNLWIGTSNGLQKLAHKDFALYTSREGLPANLVLDQITLPNAIITCGYSGVGLISRQSQVKAWIPPLQDEYFTQLGLVDNTIVGLSRKKFLKLQLANGHMSVTKTFDLPQHFISMTPLNDHGVLLGGDSSILMFRDDDLSLVTSDQVHRPTCMTVDRGTLWTGNSDHTINAYSLLDDNNHLSARLILRHKLTTNSDRDQLQCMVAGATKNSLVFGTSQRGITIAEHQGDKLITHTTIDMRSGLSSNNVWCLLWHNDTTLLVGTGNGLDKIIFSRTGNRIDIHSVSAFYNFSNAVYSLRREINGNGMLLGTEPGLMMIPTVDIEAVVRCDQPVSISAIQLATMPDSALSFREQIIFPHDGGNITISYASPFFKNDHATRFSYQMIGGSQEQWSKPTASNNVTFLNLPPGRYQFNVKAINLFGQLSTEKATLDVVIEPAFWQTLWFRLMATSIAVGVIFLLIRMRVSTARRDAEHKQQRAEYSQKLAEAEMMALRAQMNPHFIFNCMNIIDGLIADDRKEDAQDFLQKFSKLIRLVLDNSQHSLVALHQDLDALKLYAALEVIRFNHQFMYEFDIDEDLLENRIPPLLLQPYIENAIVHGLRNKEKPGGKLLVQIKNMGNYIQIKIEDNGIGRKRAMALGEENKKTHQPLGMKVTEKRIHLLQRLNQHTITITIDDLCNDEDTGTRVTITLPNDVHVE